MSSSHRPQRGRDALPSLRVAVFEGDFDVAVVFQKQGHRDEIAAHRGGLDKRFRALGTCEIAGERER